MYLDPGSKGHYILPLGPLALGLPFLAGLFSLAFGSLLPLACFLEGRRSGIV
jgi:hypothetical protein